MGIELHRRALYGWLWHRAWVVVIVSLLAVASQGRPLGMPVSSEEKEAWELVREIDSIRLAQSLRLTSEQERKISSVIRRHLEESAKVSRLEAEGASAQREALLQLRAAVFANEGVSEEVKRAVYHAEGPSKKAEKEFEQNGFVRAKEIWDVLSAQQQAQLAKRGKNSAGKGRKQAKADPAAAAESTLLNRLMTTAVFESLDSRTHAPTPAEAEASDLAATVTDIHLLNLVNSLCLDSEQMRDFIALETKASGDYGRIVKERREFAKKQLPLLRRIRGALGRGNPLSSSAESQLAKLNAQHKQLEAEEHEQDERCLASARRILRPNQIEMVSNFTPCTVPVKSLTNPERIGQAGDTSGLEQALAKLRGTSGAGLKAGTEQLKDQVEKAFRRHGSHGEEIDKIRTVVQDVVSEARQLDEAKFELQKSDLAVRLMPAGVPPAEGGQLDRRIVNYMMSPNLVPIFRERIQMERDSGR